MKIVDILNNGLAKIGAELVRYPIGDLKRRMTSLNHFNVNKVFDVGANIGEYSEELRKNNYSGEIISFEPLKDIYDLLKTKALKDGKWKCENIALGNFDGETEINVAGNINSSSLLEMMPSHLKSAPQSKYIGKQTIQVKKLDSVLTNYYKEGDVIFLKIDTQGYEKMVLEGAEMSLNKIIGLQIELSLVQLYKDSIVYTDMINFLKSKNFNLYGIEPGFSDPKTGQLLQFDGIFYKY